MNLSRSRVKPPRRFRLRAAALASVLMGLSLQTQAQLALMTEPPGSRSSEPVPNIIVSVDDSGSMGWGGIATLQQALRETFSRRNLPDGRVRLAWQSMDDCLGFPGNSSNCYNNSMRVFSGSHRDNFESWINTLAPRGGTPSHDMFVAAGDYLKRTDLGTYSPWAAEPGVRLDPVLGCRKSFQIFMTDGGWNGTAIPRDGNADGSPRYLPDGTYYAGYGNSQLRLYTDPQGNYSQSTLSDVAFHYWATDLQPGIPNQLRPRITRRGSENFGTASDPAVLDEYWNPRNNPATWQHLETYSIGFNAAASWVGSPLWQGDHFSGLAPLIQGRSNWRAPFYDYDAKATEQWHVALNSRGRFIPAPNAQALVDAFRDILADIIDKTSSAVAAATGSSFRLGAPGVGFAAWYNAEQWQGDLQAFNIDSQAVVSNPAAWSAAAKLDAVTPSNRRVLSHNGTQAGLFSWSDLSTQQRDLLSASEGEAAGQSRLAYLLGERGQEQKNGGALRDRASRLGSLINSAPLYVGKPSRLITNHSGHSAFVTDKASRRPVVYAGANDGMLHAFDASTDSNGGRELLAYVPKGVYASLRSYTRPDYTHRYMVDGSPFSGDADLGNGQWGTVLVGTLGLGGRGYFALNISDPADFATMSPSQLVLLDRTHAAGTADDGDIGHIMTPPVVDDLAGNRSEQIVKLNDGRWAVIMGNGVNSPSQRAALLIQYLDGARELKVMPTSTNTGEGNGMGAPRPVDVDGNGTVDLVYAGDLKGQLWSFNLSAAQAGDWKLRFGGSPLFRAKSSGGKAQPITAAPYVLKHPAGGLQVAFGTGRFYETSDGSSTDVQTLYGVHDRSTLARDNSSRVVVSDGATVTDDRSTLVAVTQSGTFDANRLASTTSQTIDYGQKRGWYFDLPTSGERQTSNTAAFQGNVLAFGSTIPVASSGGGAESCTASSNPGRFFTSYFDAINGSPPKVSVFGLLTTSQTRIELTTNSSIQVRSNSRVKFIDFSEGKDASGRVTLTGATGTNDRRLAPTAGAVVDWRRLN